MGCDAEGVCARRVDWSGLISLIWWKMIMWFGGSHLISEDRTIMVNAASVGGLKDDQRLGAIAIEI